MKRSIIVVIIVGTIVIICCWTAFALAWTQAMMEQHGRVERVDLSEITFVEANAKTERSEVYG